MIAYHTENAEAWIYKATEADTRNGPRWLLATDHPLYADWSRKKRDLSRAKEQPTRTIGIFKERGADGWARKYE